jgi:integrase
MRVETFINKRLNTTTVRVEVNPEGGKVAKPRSPTTVRKEVTLLSQIFNMARQERLVTENPCDFIRKAVRKKIPARRRRERAMTVGEERLLVAQLAGRREHLLPVVRLALWTGMRRGEILRLEKCDANFSDKPIEREVGGERHSVPPGWLFVEKSKNGRPRSVPMCRKVRELLRPLCDDPVTGRFVFENLRTGAAILDIKRGYSSAVREAGIDDLTFHDLRHSWSTRAEELGVPEAVRRDILGHSPGTMTASYTHSYQEARERAVELVSEYGEARTGEDCVKNAERPTLWLASRTG